VESEFASQIMERTYQTGEILQRCSEMPITAPNSNGIKFPQFSESSRANGSRLGGVSATWVNEATTATASRPKVALTELKIHKLLAAIYATDELTRDAASLETFVRAAFAQEMSFVLETCVIGGSGTNQPLGILNSNALIKVAKDNAQTPATISGANVVSALSRLWAPSRKTAVWVVNQELLTQLMGLTVASGGSERRLYHFAEEGESYDRLAGVPIIPVEHCPVAGTPGDLLLADFSRYLIAQRESRAAVSVHVNFLSDENIFRFVMRIDGQPIDAWPITPLNGTNTTSPFVAIDTR
jgi:HK97 family phage major capsid protein